MRARNVIGTVAGCSASCCGLIWTGCWRSSRLPEALCWTSSMQYTSWKEGPAGCTLLPLVCSSYTEAFCLAASFVSSKSINLPRIEDKAAAIRHR